MANMKNTTPNVEIFYDRTSIHQNPTWEFHLHDYFEIYLLLKGETSYFIGKQVYKLTSGDLVVINHKEIHKRVATANTEEYERILVFFDPNIPTRFSPSNYNLLRCFLNRANGEHNHLRLTPQQLEIIMGLFDRWEKYAIEESSSAKVLSQSYLIELLVFINEYFEMSSPNPSPPSVTISVKLVPVIGYIETHLDAELTLEALERIFFINRYYLSRLFKSETGLGIHKFIMMKRIIKAKELLSQGHQTTEVCYLTGFNDYSNFIKLFKKIVGLSPSKYLRNSTQVQRKL
ncbi:AraC family transcriptional regulator [Cohnella sp. WQ 127256]|uniref:AraC family transcriptional regulator n=1 Tax=Cohnella sp. WQ 127256 TaxID=2938790 RepID=UPI0021197426|nr:AraC family transcriptional regulator [Cohnella sp. WQ 127256]